MPSSSGSRKARALLAAVLGALGLLAAAPGAQAETIPVTCANLQSTVKAVGEAPGHGAGDTITLAELCDGTKLKSASGIVLQPGSAFTLTASVAGAGIDGTGITGPLLAGEGLGAITLSGLTFQNAVSNTLSAVDLRAARVTLTGDSFTNDKYEGTAGGALNAFIETVACPPAGTPAVTIANSSFTGDTNTVTGTPSTLGVAGAASVLDNCNGALNVLEGNLFEGNSLRANGIGYAYGGALLFASESKPGPAQLQQRGNVFAANSIVDVSGNGNYGGAGEWTEGLSIASVRDRFSANTLPGTVSPYWSWGAGLGIIACGNTEPTQSSLQDDVVVANSIGAGEAAADSGAGVYVGCLHKGTPNHLAVLDSTVTANSVAAPGAGGILGGPHDQLTVSNSILALDGGGGEIGGFAGSEGSATASYSDVCAPGSTAPMPGTGNICADPRLAGEGTPGSVDVHETYLSPTLEAGSVALVPTGLSTDFYGVARITSLFPFCGEGAALPVVDMGAAQGPPRPRPAILCPRKLPPASAMPTLPTITDGIAGVLRAVFIGLHAGRLSVTASFPFTRTVTRRVHGHRHRVKIHETVIYARAGANVGAGGHASVRLTPSARALSILRSRRRLKVALVISFTEAGAMASTRSETITVVYHAPGHRRH